MKAQIQKIAQHKEPDTESEVLPPDTEADKEDKGETQGSDVIVVLNRIKACMNG